MLTLLAGVGISTDALENHLAIFTKAAQYASTLRQRLKREAMYIY